MGKRTYSAARIGSTAFLCIVMIGLVPSPGQLSSARSKKAGLETAAPESVGWSSAKLEEARAFAERINSAAVARRKFNAANRLRGLRKGVPGEAGSAG